MHEADDLLRVFHLERGREREKGEEQHLPSANHRRVAEFGGGHPLSVKLFEDDCVRGLYNIGGSFVQDAAAGSVLRRSELSREAARPTLRARMGDCELSLNGPFTSRVVAFPAELAWTSLFAVDKEWYLSSLQIQVFPSLRA